jgi:hypothetical protein
VIDGSDEALPWSFPSQSQFQLQQVGFLLVLLSPSSPRPSLSPLIAMSSKKATKKSLKSKTSSSSKPVLAQEDASPVVASSLSEFSYLTTSMRLSVPPLFAGNQTQGCEELLDSMVMRYVPSPLSPLSAERVGGRKQT